MTSIASLRIAVLMVIQKNSSCPSTARIFHAKKDLSKVMVRQCQPEVQHSLRCYVLCNIIYFHEFFSMCMGTLRFGVIHLRHRWMTVSSVDLLLS